MTSIRTESLAPAEIYTDGGYIKKNPDWHVGDSPWKARHVLDLLRRRHLRSRPSATWVAELAGSFRNCACQMPADVHFTGFELSPHAYAMCLPRTVERLQYRMESAFDSGEYYDLALMMDVVEHVEDCYGFLRKLRDLARYKVMHIPLDLSAYAVTGRTLMRARESLGHIHYFTRATALRWLKRAMTLSRPSTPSVPFSRPGSAADRWQPALCGWPVTPLISSTRSCPSACWAALRCSCSPRKESCDGPRRDWCRAALSAAWKQTGHVDRSRFIRQCESDGRVAGVDDGNDEITAVSTLFS